MASPATSSVLYWLVGLAVQVVASHYLTPEQIHLALYGEDSLGYPTGMRVTWYVLDQPKDCTAEFGDSPNLGQTSKGVWTQYFHGHGHHCSAVLRGLKPGAPYYYRVGSSGDTTWSPQFKMTAAPSDSNAAFSMSVFGDMGYKSSKERPMIITTDGLQKHWDAELTRIQLERLKDERAIDMIWHLGDIGYADDEFAHNPLNLCTKSERFGLTTCYERMYNDYMNWLQNLTATMPYMVSVGNHESECHSPACILDPFIGGALRNFSAYNHRWQMPSDSSKGVLSMWYSFNVGPAHFVSINTETDWDGAEEHDTGDGHFKELPAGHFAEKGAFLSWLEADLANAASQRHQRPWIIVGGHRPIQSLNHSGADGPKITALLRKYGVDLYVAGHSHSYARTEPHCDGGVGAARCTVEIVVGGAGCDEMPLPTGHNVATMPFAAPPSNFSTSRMASGVLDVTRSALSWRLIESESGKIVDTYVIHPPDSLHSAFV